MPHSVLEICIEREDGQAWGFKLVGGTDVGKVVRVSKVGRGGGRLVASHVSILQVVGINKPGGLQAGDVLLTVQDKVVDRMTHKEVVNIIKGVNGKNLNMKIERGDHIIPNIVESFPIEEVENMRKVRKREI